jgi:hypothetical protein
MLTGISADLQFGRLIKLRGYHPGHNAAKDYDNAKLPVGTSWTDVNGDGGGWTKEGGWIGGTVPQGLIICDIDERETADFLHGALKKAGASYHMMNTQRGRQFFFTDTGQLKTQTARALTAGGFVCDYRLHGKGYTVLTGRTIERINDGRELSPMPTVFFPLKKHDKSKDADKLLPLPISDGQRDDTLFAHACRVRNIAALRGIDLELEPLLREVNELFCDPPKPLHVVLQKLRSAQNYPTPEHQEHKPLIKPLKVVEASELLTMAFPARENILKPILPRSGTAMIFGPRGLGKTQLVTSMAVAVAAGGHFMSTWEAVKPAGVLYVDGELPGQVVQERFARAILGAEKEPEAPLRILTPDLQELGMPDLATIEGQAAVEPFLTDDIALVILDSLSTLCRKGKENEGESWLPVQTWALDLRRRGFCVLFIHHSGKGGQQRGTSRREDILDTVINLKRAADYNPAEGARFEVHVEKARGFFGDDARPFEAKLTQEGEKYIWTTRDLEDSLTHKVADYLREGLHGKDIAELLGVSKGTVSKHKAKAEREGLL